jgi:hypothetical protein
VFQCEVMTVSSSEGSDPSNPKRDPFRKSLICNKQPFRSQDIKSSILPHLIKLFPTGITKLLTIPLFMFCRLKIRLCAWLVQLTA